MDSGRTFPCVFIEDLRCAARIGVSAEERETEQELRVDISWTADLSGATQDDFQATIDYEAVCLKARDIMASSRLKLIEALAARLASDLLGLFPAIETICIRLRKPGALARHGAACAGVELRRSRRDQGT